MQSVARPSTAGLRGAYSEGNLTDPEMYGTGVEGLRGMGGSAPWLVDNRSTRLNAAQNKYIQSNSSIFGDDSGHHAIKVQRSRQTMQDLQKQMAERAEAKRWEQEEEERLYAAMNVPTAANRNPGQVRDTAAVVEDRGGYYGGYEDYGGGYNTGNNLGGGGGGGGSSYVPSGYGDYAVPRRLPRAHVSMTSDEVDVMRAEAADQLRGDLQWQVQMKKQLEEERRQKEALEDQLLEENARQQQERMQQEYQAELDQRRRKEEEQTRRREAQLRQMDMMKQRMEAEKKEKMERARRLADLSDNTRSAPPPPREDFGRDARMIKPAGGAGGGKGSKGSVQDEFGFDALKSDSAFLAAQKPNKFFDSPSMPVKVPTNTDIRKRPKPLTPATEAPRKANNRPTLAVPRLRKEQPNRPRTTLAIGGMMETPAHPPGKRPPNEGAVTLAVPPPRPHPGAMTLAPPAGLGDGWPPRAPPQAHQSSLTPHYQQPNRHPAVPFDWKIQVDEPSQEEKRKLEQMSQREIGQFQERNTDVMSQLTALKTDLKTPRGGRDGDGDSGYVASHPEDSARVTSGGETAPSLVPLGDQGQVDVMRVSTAKEPPPKDTANKGTFNPDDTSRTILRKFMEKKKRR